MDARATVVRVGLLLSQEGQVLLGARQANEQARLKDTPIGMIIASATDGFPTLSNGHSGIESADLASQSLVSTIHT